MISCFLPSLPSTKKWLPAETVRVILLPDESLGRKQKHTDSLYRKLFTKHNSRSRAVSAEAKYDEKSFQEAKMSGLVYTPDLMFL